MANTTRTSLFVRKQAGGMFAVEDMSLGTGARYFVCSTTGTDSVGHGRNPDAPFATLDYAISLSGVTAGDIIYLMPGHVDTLADAQIDADVAGIRIVGLGWGASRPKIVFGHANSSLNIGANGVLIENVVFQSSVTVVAIGVDVEAAVTDTTIKDCEFTVGEAGDGTDDFVIGIDIKAGCTRTTIDGLVFAPHASCNGQEAGVRLTGASDLVAIKDSTFWGPQGAAAKACIEGITTLSTRILIDNCLLQTDAEPCIELLTGTTGIIRDCTCFTNLATIDAAIVADGCACIDNKYCEVGNEAGTLIKTESADD